MDHVPDLNSEACPVGHYCPRGDVSPCPIPCPNGTFSDVPGQQQESDCLLCTAGFYCNQEGLIAPVGPCPGGYYCPEGTDYPYEWPCPVGFYRNGSARESFQDCSECISGYYCDVEGLGFPKECPPGYFCVAGTIMPQPCPLGTYSNSYGLRVSSDCAPCPGGYYCDGIGRTEPAGVCDAGFYCREKAYTSAPPDTDSGGICTVGGYCPPGSAFPQACNPGEYSPNLGAKTKYDCVPCDPGYFCAGSSSEGARSECAAGYYCTGGSSVPTQHDTPVGHYSEAGAFKPEPCPRGTYQPSERSSECNVCPQGFYCNLTGTVHPVICPEGFYCPPRSEEPTHCPRGTYINAEGSWQVDHCNPCMEGYACESVGLPFPNTECAAGFYCLEGSNMSHPNEFITNGGQCPPGYYCPPGTADFALFPCPNGTYSNSSANTDISNCTQCEPGLACMGSGLTAPNAICAAGYFCRSGAYTDKPADAGATGDPCPMGFFCPEGTGMDLTCYLLHYVLYCSEILIYIFSVKYVKWIYVSSLKSFKCY